MLRADTANYESSFFARGPRGYFDTARVLPESLRLDKIDAVFIEVPNALPLVELKRWHGIKNIPFLATRQAVERCVTTIQTRPGPGSGTSTTEVGIYCLGHRPSHLVEALLSAPTRARDQGVRSKDSGASSGAMHSGESFTGELTARDTQ